MRVNDKRKPSMELGGNMRQAILTKYLAPTDYRDGRVKAQADAGSITLPWDSDLDTDENHLGAALALAAKYGWKGEWAGGGMPQKGTVWACCFVQVPE